MYIYILTASEISVSFVILKQINVVFLLFQLPVPVLFYFPFMSLIPLFNC